MNSLDVVTLKDGGKVFIRSYRAEDKEMLFEMYESLSDDALCWVLPPFTREN